MTNFIYGKNSHKDFREKQRTSCVGGYAKPFQTIVINKNINKLDLLKNEQAKQRLGEKFKIRII